MRGGPGRGTLDKERPPIFGMVERGGALVLLVLQMLANVRQATIQPLIRATIAPSSLINTDEYNIYARLSQWVVAQGWWEIGEGGVSSG